MRKQLKQWLSGFFMVAVGLVVILSLGYHLPKWFLRYANWAWPQKKEE